MLGCDALQMYRYLHFEVIFALCLHGRIKGYLESGSTIFLRDAGTCLSMQTAEVPQIQSTCVQ